MSHGVHIHRMITNRSIRIDAVAEWGRSFRCIDGILNRWGIQCQLAIICAIAVIPYLQTWGILYFKQIDGRAP